MILSPVHICLLVTSEHFSTRAWHGIVRLIPPVAAVLLAGVAFYFILAQL